MKRALLVGIDQYDNFSNLGGCVNDVKSLYPLLRRHENGDLNFEVQSLISSQDKVTRDSLLGGIRRLFAPGADVAVLYFAGHGAQVDGDVSLVVADGSRHSPGVLVSETLGSMRISGVREAVLILDCCYSGGAGSLPALGSAASILPDGLSILTASRNDQTSAETPQGRGLFSTHLEGALEGGAADVLGKVTVSGLYAYLSELFGAWEQRPAFRASIDRAHELRRCKSAVPLEELRSLPAIFPNPHKEVELDPSFEPTENPRDEVKESLFKVLQRCRSAKLVEPVDEEHMYYAALNRKSCRLTPLGRHYWQMAKEDRI